MIETFGKQEGNNIQVSCPYNSLGVNIGVVKSNTNNSNFYEYEYKHCNTANSNTNSNIS